MESTDSIPERCSYTIATPTCQHGTTCQYAHFDKEREELILSLQDYDEAIPRPVPRADKLLPYSLCENHKNDKKRFNGKCIYGVRCKQAHSLQELKDWEAQRKGEESRRAVVRPFDAWVSQLKLCRGICAKGVRCPFAHSREELKKWTKKYECE